MCKYQVDNIHTQSSHVCTYYVGTCSSMIPRCHACHACHAACGCKSFRAGRVGAFLMAFVHLLPADAVQFGRSESDRADDETNCQGLLPIEWCTYFVGSTPNRDSLDSKVEMRFAFVGTAIKPIYFSTLILPSAAVTYRSAELVR